MASKVLQSVLFLANFSLTIIVLSGPSRPVVAVVVLMVASSRALWLLLGCVDLLMYVYCIHCCVPGSLISSSLFSALML